MRTAGEVLDPVDTGVFFEISPCVYMIGEQAVAHATCFRLPSSEIPRLRFRMRVNAILYILITHVVVNYFSIIAAFDYRLTDLLGM
jgi:hypothetical protein